jgi:hypothetical protein
MKKESDYYNALYIFPLFMEGIFFACPYPAFARVATTQTDELKSIFPPNKRQLMHQLFQFRNQYTQLFTFLLACHLLCLSFMLKLTV